MSRLSVRIPCYPQKFIDTVNTGDNRRGTEVIINKKFNILMVAYNQRMI